MSDAIKRHISPIAWVPTVYFAMGMPFVVLNMVTALMFKGLGISDAQIAFWTSIIMFPWTIKPLWSPFLEMFKTKKYFVVLTQFCSGVFFGLVALSLQLPHFFAISIALLGVIAFSGATHDVATDGVYMAVLSKEDQAKYIGWQGAFYNVAKLAATGGLVYLAGFLIEHIGVVHAWMTIMGCCGAIMLLLALYHWKMLPSDQTEERHAVTSLGATWEALKEVILTFFQSALYPVHYPLPVCGRIGDEDCTPLPESSDCQRWIGTDGTGDRILLRDVRRGGIRVGLFFGRLFHFALRLAQDIVLPLLRVQLPLCRLSTLGAFPTR